MTLSRLPKGPEPLRQLSSAVYRAAGGNETFRRCFSSVQEPSTKISALPNGMRVATQELPGQSATVGVWIDTGSRYENDRNNGVAHFLEHMAFKGTRTRSQYQIEREVEDMGAHLNAYTSREQTVYYAKVLQDHVPYGMEILADILTNSEFNRFAVERERDVILREMQEVESMPEEVVFDRLHEIAYQGTPLARTILGPRENILSISVADIRHYIATHYTAPRMVVVAAGAVKHEQIIELADRWFGGYPKVAPEGFSYQWEDSKYTGSDIRIPTSDQPLTHLALSFEGVSWVDSDSYTLMAMQALLGMWDRNAGAGGAMSSRLCQAIAQGELAHSMMPFNTCYIDSGLFGLYAVAEGDKVPELSQRMQEEMVRLCFDVSEEDAQRAKSQLKSNLIMQLDGTSQVAEDIGRQVLTCGRRMPLAETFARIDAITVEDVKRVAKRVVWDQEPSVVVIGTGSQGLPAYPTLRQRTGQIVS